MIRPGALLENVLCFTLQYSSTPNKHYTLLFLTGEDDIARFDSRRYNDILPFLLRLSLFSLQQASSHPPYGLL
jgi:hypothetical protein